MDLKEKIISCLPSGKSDVEIAKLCSCSHQYVRRVRSSTNYTVDESSPDSTSQKGNLSGEYREWFAREWNAAVSKLRGCRK